MAGRRPKPTALKLLEGNPGKGPLYEEPKPPPGRPTIPAKLSTIAKREWDRVLPILEGMGLASTADRAVIAAYCAAYARWITAERHIVTAESLLGKGNSNKSKWLRIAEDAMKQMIHAAECLGLSPSSRAKLGRLRGVPDDELGELLAQRTKLRARRAAAD